MSLGQLLLSLLGTLSGNTALLEDKMLPYTTVDIWIMKF
jgi:hypothetical protein